MAQPNVLVVISQELALHLQNLAFSDLLKVVAKLVANLVTILGPAALIQKLQVIREFFKARVVVNLCFRLFRVDRRVKLDYFRLTDATSILDNGLHVVDIAESSLL